MENPYIKQYPDLMAGKTILYNHGFGSSAASGTVRLIRQTFPEARVVAYDLPLHPAEAMAMLHEKVAADKPDLIIGTSMGGMYTEMLYGVDRICVNPAFEMAQTMKEHGLTGQQHWQNPRQDGETDFLVTKALEKEYKEMTEQCFLALDTMTDDERTAEQRRVWGLFGDEDNLVNTWSIFREHYVQAVHFHGGHRMDDHSFLTGIVPVIRWIDDRQESREREVVYISWDALRDDYGKPKSSLQKTVSQLVERYQVYVIAPAPTNDHASLADEAAWCEQYLSVPLFDRVVYANRPELLLGDFLISSSPHDGFMGTVIQLGSRDFKTWEDIETYFSRI